MLKSAILLTFAAAACIPSSLHAQGSLIVTGPSREPLPTATDSMIASAPFPDSIYIAPIPNAPFTATIVGDRTSVQNIRPNSPNVTIQFAGNNRIVARDSAGHIMMEQRAFIHDGQKLPSELLATDFIAPKERKFLRCIPQQKTCYLYSLRTTAQGYDTYTAMDAPVLGLLPTMIEKLPDVTVKTLGQKTLEGVSATGYRARFEVNRCAGSCADLSRTPSSQPNAQVFTSELWFAPDLQMDLKMNYSNDAGDHTDTMKDLKRAEPDPKLFQIPNGYKVVNGAAAN